MPHIALKPQAAGIETNLTIYTTKHIYHLILRSRRHAMQEVEFYYPRNYSRRCAADDAVAGEEQTARIAIDPPDETTDAASVKAGSESAELAYTIDGSEPAVSPGAGVRRRPHVYLEMPASMKTSEAPALLIGAAGGTQMVNYRVRGSYFVVDRLFDKGVLLAGVGGAGPRGDCVRGSSEVGR